MDYIQLGFSFVAIMLLAVVAGWLFPVKNRLNKERATRNLVRCYPDLVPEGALVGTDGLSALVPVRDNIQVLGFVTLLGDRVVARLISHDDIAQLKEDGGGIEIHFNDFTQPVAKLSISGKEKEKAHNLLKSLSIRVVENAA